MASRGSVSVAMSDGDEGVRCANIHPLSPTRTVETWFPKGIEHALPPELDPQTANIATSSIVNNPAGRSIKWIEPTACPLPSEGRELTTAPEFLVKHGVMIGL